MSIIVSTLADGIHFVGKSCRMSTYINEIKHRMPGSLVYDRLLIYRHQGSNLPSEHLDKPARIDAYMMVLCTKGNILVESNHKEYFLEEGAVFFSGPHSLLNASISDEAEAYVLVMEASRFMEAMGSSLFAVKAFDMLYTSPMMLLDERQQSIVKLSISVLIQAIGSRQTQFKDNIINSLSTAFLFIFANIADECGSLSAEHQRDAATDIFYRFAKLLSEEYATHRDVAYYADRMCLSTRYLTTVVRKVSGATVSQWISRLVINDAKYMLKYTELSVKEVAYKLNFPNNSFFCKYFRKHTGQTPIECRKSYLKG